MKSFLFPGQGAQYPGMGQSFYDNFESSREIFSIVSEVMGFDISQKCFLGTSEELKDTGLQQVAILTVSIAAYEALRAKTVQADYLCGLSLGEYTALYAAKVLSLEDLVVLVRERAKAMQMAAEINQSTMMAVVGVGQGLLESIAKEEGFYLANFNSANQIVISLKSGDKDRIEKVLEQRQIKFVPLQVSGGFHSPFMEPARRHLEATISSLDFFDAKIPIVSNVTAIAHTDKDIIKKNLADQLISPVRWFDCVTYLVSCGVLDFFEVGPSKILKGLIRKINPSVKVTNIEKAEDVALVLKEVGDEV
ncbi:MAG: ACP S-malonyltransferase [Candidatus Omnitrophica bacterium]|nr:ACP S-malonyltransferase [Candidatus Omnitrophota bacterium]